MPTACEIERETVRRLVKILERTRSGYDGEALTAARKANALLSRAGMSYEMLFDHVQRVDSSLVEELHHLKHSLAAERRKSALLAAALRQAEAAKPEASMPLLHNLEQLRQYLMGHFVLKKHERALLERIEDPKPKSKEAHIVLICAQRYGVAYG